MSYRTTAVALTLVGLPMLIVGNWRCPEVPWRDFTPFDLGGLVYFVFLVPVGVLLATQRQWIGLACLGALFHASVGVLTWAWVGPLAGTPWLLVASLGLAALTTAKRSGSSRRRVRVGNDNVV